VDVLVNHTREGHEALGVYRAGSVPGRLREDARYLLATDADRAPVASTRVYDRSVSDLVVELH
jgi:hypothetical protein